MGLLDIFLNKNKSEILIEVGNKFRKVDILALDLIASMMHENRLRYDSLSSVNINSTNLVEAIIEILKDAYEIQDINEFDTLFTSEYFRRKGKKLFIGTLFSANRVLGTNYNFFSSELDEIYEYMDRYQRNKINRIYYDDIDNNKYGLGADWKVPTISSIMLEYLVDVLATSACVAKVLFINEKVYKMNEQEEFFVIIRNMKKEINDIDLIINKTKPIYDEFYNDIIGSIDNNAWYKIFVKLLISRIETEKVDVKNDEILDISKNKIGSLYEYSRIMKDWTERVSKQYTDIDMYMYILFKIKYSIEILDGRLYLSALYDVYEYLNLYNNNIKISKRNIDKERYLKGDFSKEKIEQAEKYSLNNITTGTQFELYLVNLFKELGYQTKHNGKSGDQGADLIVKKDEYVYAIQAKYYTDKLSNTPVQEIIGALKYYNANQGVVITNSTFTKGAQDLAKANNVILIDGIGLKKLLDYVLEDGHEKDVLQKFII